MTASLTRVNEHCRVLKLANYYFAIHVRDKEHIAISNASKDIKTAQLAAKTFAEAQKIAYDENLEILSKPIMAVVECDSLWYPAALYSDTLIRMNFDSKKKESANDFAKSLAKRLNLNFLPECQISVDSHKK